MSRDLSARSEERAEERHQEENGRKHNRNVVQRAFEATPRARDARAAEHATASVAFDLKQDDHDERDRNNNLNDVEIRTHSFSFRTKVRAL